MNVGDLFSIDDKSHILIFENEASARLVSFEIFDKDTDINMGYFQAVEIGKESEWVFRFWTERTKDKATLSKPGQIVFLAKRSYMCWLVIADEHIGWIAVKDTDNKEAYENK